MSLYDGNPALPTGSLILVTGANGFIGSHLCDQLLQLGYKVRGTVRDKARCQWIIDLFEKGYPGLFEAVEVPNMSASGVFDSLLQDATGLAHVATESTGGYDPTVTVTATVESTVQILQSALKSSSVKRFVLTSSSSAVYTPSRFSKKPRTITAHDWNIETVSRAWESPPYTPDRYFHVYGACKAQSEFALWKAWRESEAQFVVNTVAPDSNFGPSLSSEVRSSTGKLMYDAWAQADGEALRIFSDGGYRWCVDVRDTARLHVAALLDPEVKGERLLGYAHKYDGHDIVEFFKRLDEELGQKREFKSAVPEDWSCIDVVDTSRSEEALRRLGSPDWTAKEDFWRDNLLN